jgi:23S rRNA (guanosine2251-2'-O)-methyltransferase
VDKVMLAQGAAGPAARQIVAAAAARQVPLVRAPAHRIKLLAGNGKHDNGVLADVVAPRMRTLTSALAVDYRDLPNELLLLDGVRTPANVGMILRTATAAAVDGVVVPHRGVASLDPLVVKASAGVAFRAPVLRCGTAAEAAEQLVDAGYGLIGLRADASVSVFDVDIPAHTAFVLGSETDGVGDSVGRYVAEWVRIPMPGGGDGRVESLNVASAAAVVCFELVRRREATGRRL